MKQDPLNPASVPSVERIQIQKLFVYDVSPLDLEMLRRAALEPITPPDTLDLTFSASLLSVATSALFCIVGLGATSTVVKDWVYPVLGMVTAMCVVSGVYFAFRYRKSIVVFKEQQRKRSKIGPCLKANHTSKLCKRRLAAKSCHLDETFKDAKFCSMRITQTQHSTKDGTRSYTPREGAVELSVVG